MTKLKDLVESSKEEWVFVDYSRVKFKMLKKQELLKSEGIEARVKKDRYFFRLVSSYDLQVRCKDRKSTERILLKFDELPKATREKFYLSD